MGGTIDFQPGVDGGFLARLTLPTAEKRLSAEALKRASI
jgi:hypothetical protein